jgi:flagellar hook-basal body complex protein FliE
MARRPFSDWGATDEEVLESLQEEFDGMQKTARAYAARCRDLEVALNEIVVATTSGNATLETYTWIKNRATKALGFERDGDSNGQT